MNNLFNNKDINLSLIGIPILLSISICLYVFSDVTQSIKVLKSIYENAALQLENVFEFGGFLIFVFLVLISLMPTASKKITIAIDAMGGDNSPDKTIHGLSLFLKEKKSDDVFFNLFGDEPKIIDKIKKYSIKKDFYK